MKNSLWYITIGSLLLLAACSPQHYTGGTAETDELYYIPGDQYISDQPAQYADDYGAEAPDAAMSGEEEYDYYNPDAAAGGIPNFGRRWNGNMNGFNQPRFNVGVMSMWGRPGMNMGIGFNNPMPSDYFMGYSAFGSPMWGNMGGMGWNDPFWGPTCFNTWNQPWGWNNGWNNPWGGWNNGWNSPWGWGNPYAWNNPWNNPWNSPWGWNNGFWGNDLWGNNPNLTYGPRNPVYQDTPAGGSYGADQMYNPSSPRTSGDNVRPIQIGDRPLREIERDLNGADAPDTDYRAEPNRSNRSYEYYNPRGSNTNRGNNTRQQPTQRQRNNGWNWDNFFDNGGNNGGNNTRQRQSTSPNRGSSPSMNRSRGGGFSPSSPSRGSGGSGGGRSTGRSSGGRR